MNKLELLQRIDKIFRANTIDVEKIIGQYDQKKTVKEIENIEELKTDIKDLISDEFKKGEIDKKDVFVGNRKLGASYNIKDALEIAKKWGYKYVSFNEGRIFTIEGKNLGIFYNEL